MSVAPAANPQLPNAPTWRTNRDEDQPCVLLTAEEAAERLAIGRTAVYALLKTGELDSVRIGRLRRIPANAVENYVHRLIADQTTAEEK
ncbi:MAG: helix-turn-helix domain-containing protein [Actinophytocola sp.]|nr:helix-turn-helix domain-containing protein [Actinophytocola sp.]